MPLFFLLSGYCTMLVVRRRGLGSLLRQRFARIFVPLVLALVTIVPLDRAIERHAVRTIRPEPSVAGILAGDAEAVWARLADAASWMYLAHVPLVHLAKLAIREGPLAADAKFLLILAVVTAILLVSYRWCVRYTASAACSTGPVALPRHAENATVRPARERAFLSILSLWCAGCAKVLESASAPFAFRPIFRKILRSVLVGAP